MVHRLGRFRDSRSIRAWAFVLLGFTLVSSHAAAEQTQYLVKKQKVYDLKSMFASVQTMDVTQGRARIGGTLIELLVDEGDVVKAGQKLARVRDAKQNLQIAAIESKIRSLEAQQAMAQSTLKRVSILHETGKMSQSQLDKAETQLDVVSNNIAALKLNKAVIRESEVQGNVLAPASGRVLSVKVTEGTVVLPGEPIADIAANIYILRLLLPERHARFIKTGDSVLVAERGMLDSRSPSSQKTHRKGIIAQVYPELDNGRVVADVNVDGLGDFFIGERIRVWVSTDKRDAYVIPEQFIHRRYGLSYVNLANGAEIVVQTGIAVDGGIEVLSGVRDGDALLLSSTQASSYSGSGE